MTAKSLFRCAVYTRKSTEEGLEQEFNSLDAQREACEAYVRSQGGLGWKLVSKRYDDGGVSGGTMERPALQQLLSDIQAKGVDVVVVYKIDRLTRSLMDFSRMVEVFDANEVSFVSVTQQFNTTTSMGRLTLNVLLSFAQFEREVTAERIRDKIAASKKKGIWMGGPVPLGYDLKDRQLLVNETEAATVRRLYEIYLTLGSVRRLKAESDHLGIKTKDRSHVKGPFKGLRPFTRGNLYRLLSNPIYLGQIEHHDTVYEGQHPAIIDQALWDRVQVHLRDRTVSRQSASNVSDIHILTGLIFDETGDRLSPTHAKKQGRRYRYYISNRLMEAHRKEKGGWRLPADRLERAVLSALNQFLSDSKEVIDLTQIPLSTTDEVEWLNQEIISLKKVLIEGAPMEQRRSLAQFIARIKIEKRGIQISVDLSRLRMLLLETSIQILDQGSTFTEPTIHLLHTPFDWRRRFVESKAILGNGIEETAIPNSALITVIARAYRWFHILTEVEELTIERLATVEKTDANEISRILPLALLAPNAVARFAGNGGNLCVTELRSLRELPPGWKQQELFLGSH